ncbi:hypothetical protein ACFVT5_39405 [Streptomyces sp. NPDC058001]|uniref:hypothetical protein n=1 Tax=Streptomyces sp. NPDC058001 TaxID=3346300 RepID=UPI0036E423DB
MLVEDHDGLLLLRLPTDDTLSPADVADLARALRAENGETATIVAAAEGAAETTALWPRLSETLDSLRVAGTPCVRLVMSGAGDDRPGRPALARRIAEDWGLTVEAPDGPVLVVPGGSVFTPSGTGGWRRFVPGEEPETLGPRAPAPGWQAAVRRAPSRMADGCVVDQIPAGLLIRPAEATAPRPGDLFHAIPVDPRRLAVVVGVPWGEDVLATDVAGLLGALPAVVRHGVRLVPGGRRDLLPLGQSVAGLLKAEVEVTTGLPLFAADGPLGTYGVRSVLVGPDGDPRWMPFVDAVMCPPPEEPAAGSEAEVHRPEGASPPGSQQPVPAPRVLRWSSPARDLHATEDGVISLSDEWRAVITRAGLWVLPSDGTPPPYNSRPVSIEGPVLEVGRIGDRLDASLWPVLNRFVGRLAPDVRARTTLHVRAATPDGGRALRGLVADHALRVISFAPPASALHPVPRRTAPARSGDPAHGAAGSGAGAPSAGPVRVAGSVGMPRAAGGVGGTAVRRGRSPASASPGASVAMDGGVATGSRSTAQPLTASPHTSGGEPGAAPTSPYAELSAEPVSEPAVGLVSEPVSEPVLGTAAGSSVSETVLSGSGGVLSVSEGVLSEAGVSVPALPEAPASESSSGPVSAPQAPRPKAVATGVPTGPDVLASTLPAVGSPAALPSAPDPFPSPESSRSSDGANGPPQPVTSRPPDDGAAGQAAASRPPGGSGARRPRSALPVQPGHRSTPRERSAFRALAEPLWERHSAAVNRVLAQMPTLRGDEQEAARTDLIALRMYLHDGEGALGHSELTHSLRVGERRLMSYAGCLASGLGRLPSYRGPVLRGLGGAIGHGDVGPGDLLCDPAPLSGLPLDPSGTNRVAGVAYAIWSITGRRVRQLQEGGDEVVFAPGTAFRVLEVRNGTPTPLVLLRQVRGTNGASTSLEDADETALESLSSALADRTSPGTGTWHDRCTGPIDGH